MTKVRLGKTNLMVTRTSFGALPIQRRDTSAAVEMLRRAFDAGITFYDTARAYSDSEAKIGAAFSPAMRQKVVIASKSGAKTAQGLRDDLETSLRCMNTDYIDIYQFHNPPFVPRPGGEDGLYDAALAAKAAGKIRHISITNHRPAVAREAAQSGLFDTMQFPFSMLSDAQDLALVELCRQQDMGFIAMKALAGGLITNATAAFAFLRQYEHVVPIWGVQHMHELEEFIALEQNPPAMDDEMLALIERERAALGSSFCRGCGYCQPCPQNIEIFMAARIHSFITRAPYADYITPDYQAKMDRVLSCTNCGACKTRCPYGLDTPALLRTQHALYRQFVAQHADGPAAAK